MGRASELPGNNPTLTDHPKMTFKSAGYTYTVETRNGQSRYTVSDGTNSITIPILWALGSQAQTWVLERNGKLFESQVSYYPSIKGLDITTGDDLWHPKNLEEAVGRPIGDEEAKVCFGCHTSGAVVDHKFNLAAAKPGVTCEHCHVGASAHFAGVVKGDMSTVPKKLGSLTSEDLSNFCGQCHRSWETVVRSHWHGSGRCALPALPAGQQQVLRRHRPQDQLRRLPRSAQEAGARFARLTTTRNASPATRLCCPQALPAKPTAKSARSLNRTASAATCPRSRCPMA